MDKPKGAASERVGNRRLLKLAELLRGLPRKRFNYNQWVGLDWQGAPDLSCGTHACALGWATTIPVLRRAGLRLRSTRRGVGYIALEGDGSDDLAQVSTCLHAAGVVFSLSDDDARHLFIPGENEYSATAKQVAKKIERLVAARA